MKRQVGVVVLAVSLTAGVAVGVAAHALAPDRPPTTTATPVAATTPVTADAGASAHAAEPTVKTSGVEVEHPVLVSNTDGTATLSATLVNHTTGTVTISNEFGADEREPLGLLVYDSNKEVELEPGVPKKIGTTRGGYWIRTQEHVDVGLTYRIGLEFSGGGNVKVGAPPLTIEARAVERTPAEDGIANNGPNPVIKVTDGVVVVVPGQDKAYIGGRITDPINDGAHVRPTAIDSRGRSLAWSHQTVTGGGFGVTLTQPPYLDGDRQGEADYFLAKDVTVGETITATIQYPSGDVIAKFTVVQGRADGTI